MKNREWYIQRREKVANNVNRLNLADGTILEVWTHPGSSGEDARVLSIRIYGTLFDHVSLSTEEKKEKAE